MRAADLSFEEIFRFSEGTIDLQGRQLVLHSLNAMAIFRKDLFNSLNPDDTRRMLTRFGYFGGQADAAAMKRIFKWDSMEEWLKAGARLQEFEGAGRTVIRSLHLDEKEKRLQMEIIWRDSGEAKEHLLEIGKSDMPVCWMLSGYISGYASFCLDKNVYFVEKKCRACGNCFCIAVGKDIDSWGTEAESFIRYFQFNNIKNRVLELTQELKRKNRELSRHRKRLDMLEKVIQPEFIEIHSKKFRKVIEIATKVARFDTSVLITGETGTGKEVLARYIHDKSPRAKGPFLGVNCSALPETLLESELFGHKAGSFTGAIKDTEGLFEQAGKGTIFLDEIGDLSPNVQIKLLRVLQEREIMRVGESKTRKVDVRIIAATNRDLDQCVLQGTFRKDLLYRLRVIEIHVPPLRERKEDIIHLARHFVRRVAVKLKIPNLYLDPSCIDYLQTYQWPGNVRELENAIEHAAVLSRDGAIRPEYLPPAVVQSPIHHRTGNILGQTLKQVEQEHIIRVLEKTGGNKTQAAKILGISAATLWRKLKLIENTEGQS